MYRRTDTTMWHYRLCCSMCTVSWRWRILALTSPCGTIVSVVACLLSAAGDVSWHDTTLWHCCLCCSMSTVSCRWRILALTPPCDTAVSVVACLPSAAGDVSWHWHHLVTLPSLLLHVYCQLQVTYPGTDTTLSHCRLCCSMSTVSCRWLILALTPPCYTAVSVVACLPSAAGDISWHCHHLVTLPSLL